MTQPRLSRFTLSFSFSKSRTTGIRTLTNRVRAGHAANNTSVPCSFLYSARFDFSLVSPLLHSQLFSSRFVLANHEVGLERFELSPNGLKVRHAATYTTTPWTSLGLRVYLFGLTLHWDSCVISAWGFWLKVGAN